MPRTVGTAIGGMNYHSFNRGNRRNTVFHKPADFDAFMFTASIHDARRRVSVDLGGATMASSLRHDRARVAGHVCPGRFKALPLQDDDRLATVLRYVERNPVHAESVARAEHWIWSSLPGCSPAEDPLLWHGTPAPRDAVWSERVNEPLSIGDLQRLRHSELRGRPFVNDDCTRSRAQALGLLYLWR